MTNGQIKKELLCMAEEEYQKFASSLIPGVRGVLGVRLPALRKLAKQIAKEDWRTYLENAADDSFEEIMLQGFVIGSAPMEFSRRLKYIAAFLPKIDNWSVCDSFCTSLKATKEHMEEMWEFILPRLSCGREYEIRFAVVMMLNYYISEDYPVSYTHLDVYKRQALFLCDLRDIRQRYPGLLAILRTRQLKVPEGIQG